MTSKDQISTASISTSYEWDMGHRISNHDSKCRNPHGHRYRLIVEIEGEINTVEGSPKQGMVVDFDDLKPLVRTNIIDKLDHCFMYWVNDKQFSDFAKQNKDLKMFEVSFVPTAECIVNYIATQLDELLKKKVPEARLKTVTLFETPQNWATWTGKQNG